MIVSPCRSRICTSDALLSRAMRAAWGAISFGVRVLSPPSLAGITPSHDDDDIDAGRIHRRRNRCILGYPSAEQGSDVPSRFHFAGKGNDQRLDIGVAVRVADPADIKIFRTQLAGNACGDAGHPDRKSTRL